MATVLLGAGAPCIAQAQAMEPAQPPAPTPSRTQPALPPAPQVVEIEARPLTDTELRRREPVARQIVGRDELDKYGDTAVSDVLKRLPGVNVSGGNPRLRGLGAGYTLILVNGEPAPPGFSLDNLSPSQVERIEITKGPTAEHSTQAVAGTINIVLREPPRQTQREFKLNLGVGMDRPIPGFQAIWGGREGALSYTLPFSYYRWRGGHEARDERSSLDVDGQPYRAISTGNSLWWGHGFNFGPRGSWKLGGSGGTLALSAWLQRSNFRNSGQGFTEVLEGRPPISVDDRRANRGHWQVGRLGGQWNRRFADGAAIELKAGVQASGSDYRTDVDGRDAGGVHTLTRVAQGLSRERGGSTGGKFTQPVGEAHTLAIGWEIDIRRRREERSVFDNGVSQLAGFDGEPFSARIARSAVYVQDEWTIAPRWGTYLGLRAEQLDFSSTASDGTVASRHLVVSPLWHLTHRLDERGRDLVRASITRSYKAPDPAALLGRPSINGDYPVSGGNPESSPDRVGNPALEPELATGLDLALEKYLPGGGMVSVGVFHRRIKGLIRQRSALQSVPWAAVPRWVSRPVNYPGATSSGVELELKGSAAEWLPAALAAPSGLQLRASASVYRSQVDDLPGPDNRLDQQQPWALTLGLDHKLSGMPLTWGATLALAPAYRVQQTERQALDSGRSRSLDIYALWAFSRESSLRVALNRVAAPDEFSQTVVTPAAGPAQTSTSRRSVHAGLQASWTWKF